MAEVVVVEEVDVAAVEAVLVAEEVVDLAEEAVVDSAEGEAEEVVVAETVLEVAAEADIVMEAAEEEVEDGNFVKFNIKLLNLSIVYRNIFYMFYCNIRTIIDATKYLF